MKRSALILSLVFLAVATISCQSPLSPDPVPTKAANIVLDGGITQGMTSYGRPVFTGTVKNVGNNTAYNCKIAFTCYADAAQTTIADTANGFPAELGDIEPGKLAVFEAIAFSCDSWDDIKSYTYKITWLDR